MQFSTQGPTPTAVLVGIQLPETNDEEFLASMAELERLVHTLGLRVVGRVVQRRENLAAAAVLGEGKLKELAALTGGKGVVESPAKKPAAKARERFEVSERLRPEAPPEVAVNEEEEDGEEKRFVVVVDHELSPSQARNLEKASGAEVLDRTGVIVEIFHRHARSREAKLQVELARLAYVAPRLRETGGGDRVRGGVGNKGAGESSLELDRRKIRDRMAELRAELASIRSEQDVRRSRRQQARRVALVGYTNAGKSSLMRALTGSEVYIADKLFATLDTTVRALHPEVHPRVLVSDTVGFIKKLPHDLVASFRSTLDEALEASLLLFVVDAADPTFRSQLEVTKSVLGEIGALEVPSMLVLNKSDLVSEEQRDSLRLEFPEAIFGSAKDPEGIARVREAILTFFEGENEECELLVPYAAKGVLGPLREESTVLSESYEENGTRFVLRGPKEALGRIKRLLSEATRKLGEETGEVSAEEK